MAIFKTCNGLLQFVLAFLLMGSVSTSLFAQQKANGSKQQQSIAAHSHTPIHINARPILKPYEASLNEPRRMQFDSKGNLWVANWGAGTLLMINKADEVLTVASGLNEPSGIAIAADGNIFVS